MEKTIEEQIKELKNISGNVLGEKFYTTFNYLKTRKKKQEIKEIFKKMEKLGYPINLQKISSSEMYPIKTVIIFFIVIKNIFNWTDKDFFEMGRYAPKISFITRIFLGNLISIKTIFNKAPSIWKRHYDFGLLETVEIKEKHFIVRIKNFDVHPIICPYHGGYFQMMAEFCLKNKEIKTVETKCIHKGDEYHEYLMSWK